MNFRAYYNIVSSALVMTLTIVCGRPVAALPVDGEPSFPSPAPTGTIQLSGANPTSLRIEFSGSSQLLQHYTFGLYDLSLMTAGPNDPDFQIQALQADRAIVLQEFGSPLSNVFELTIDSDAELGIFLLRDATLEDFSLGENDYRPIFTSVGASGSHMLEQFDTGEGDGTLFTLPTFQTIGGMGGVMLAGTTPLLDPGSLTITVTSTQGAPIDPNPIVPEPGTFALVGLGATLLGFSRRRRLPRS